MDTSAQLQRMPYTHQKGSLHSSKKQKVIGAKIPLQGQISKHAHTHRGSGLALQQP